MDLGDVLDSRTWRWFRTRLAYLLAEDGPLSRALAPEQEPPSAPSWSDPAAPQQGTDY